MTVANRAALVEDSLGGVQMRSQEWDTTGQIKQNLVSHFGMQQFIGGAPAFMAAIEKIPQIADCDAAVLLTGETGTGKEMCARAIHYLSRRASSPFVPVNCGSIPIELFENELFGHKPGAFTDARQPQRGLIAEAERGTLFLDEVETLPPLAQVKLLRFLQDRQYKPLGGSRCRQADIRLLAASNEDLREKVRERAFRQDLYFRLRVVSLTLPPLRDRQEDLLPLSCHFLQRAAQEYNRTVTGFSREAIQKLKSYAWPGNVREMENVIRQAVVLSEGPMIRARDLQLFFEPPCSAPLFHEPLRIAKARLIEDFERAYLKEALSACGGNISQAARRAQKDRRAFFELLKKYRLNSTHLDSPGAQAGWQHGLPPTEESVAVAPLSSG
jgi:two-component system response regulator GlrR